MTLDANTYGRVVTVESRIRDIPGIDGFTPSSTPTEADVELILDGVADEINNILQTHGYTIPLTAADSSTAFGWAGRANSAGAAAIVLNSRPGPALDVDGADPLANRKAGLWDELNRFLKAVEQETLFATRDRTRLGRFKVGSAFDRKTGLRKLPVFTRDMTDFPAARSLTEPA